MQELVLFKDLKLMQIPLANAAASAASAAAELTAKMSTSSCKLQMSVIQRTHTHTHTLAHPLAGRKWACSGVEFNTFLCSHIKCLAHIRPPAYELGAGRKCERTWGGSSSTWSRSRSCHCYFKGACCLSFDDHFKNIFLTSFCRSFSAKKTKQSAEY